MVMMRPSSDEGFPVGLKSFPVGINIAGPAISMSQPGQCSITDAWVKVNGSRVNEVAPGQEFEIWCTYNVQDLGLNPLNPLDRTLVCITVKDDSGQIKNYEDHLLYGTGVGSQGSTKLAKLGANIMPEQAINLSFKAWFNDDSNIQPAYPPQNVW